MIKLIQLTVFIVLLSGCSQSVTVKSEFPQPVVEPYPLVIGVRYPTELRNFVHIEDPIMDSEWTIRLGEANLSMFRTLFAGMFERVIELDVTAPGQPAEGVDAIIEPELEELEFTVPQQSGNDQFTVWLRYNLRLLTPQGTLIGDWRITAYGQQDEGMFGMGDEAAMHAALITALRDAAAGIITGFSSAPGVRDSLLPSDNADQQPGS